MRNKLNPQIKLIILNLLKKILFKEVSCTLSIHAEYVHI